MTSEKPRGIEKTGHGYRVTVSVGGVPKRRGTFETIEQATVVRDQLDIEAKFVREQRRRGAKGSSGQSHIGTLDEAAKRDMKLTESGGASREEEPPSRWGIESRLVRGEVKYAARRWVRGKMRWGGVHASLEEAIKARDALK